LITKSNFVGCWTGLDVPDKLLALADEVIE
jgi:hypothetical protein